MELEPGNSIVDLTVAVISWSIGIVGIVVFFYAMSHSTTHATARMLLLSVCALFVLLVGSIVVIARGYIERKRIGEESDQEGSISRIKVAISLGYLGVLTSGGMFFCMAYFLLLYLATREPF